MITEEQIQERLHELPQEMFDAVTSDERVVEIQKVAAKYDLRIDKVEDLIEEVGLVMLGFKKSHEFVRALSQRLKVNKETAESIAIDVDEQVFKKIRRSLQEVHYGDEFDGVHDIEQEEVGASPARDSLIREVESHAEEDNENPLVGVSSKTDYDPALFAQTKPGGVTATRPVVDPYREVPTVPTTPSVSEPAPTPFETHTNMGSEHESQETVDPSKTFKDTLQEKVDPMKKAAINQDPYRESIE